MATLCCVVFLTGAYPVWRAIRANQRTSLRQAVCWAAVAWLAWGWLVVTTALRPTAATDAARYVALCLTACSGVAVLGARRPGVAAWNFVVVGLLAVMLLPLAEGLVIRGAFQLTAPRALFLAATLAVGVLVNYLPTRLAPAAVLLAAACTLETFVLVDRETAAGRLNQLTSVSHWLVGLAPWVAYARLRWWSAPASAADRLWLDFRDRYGFVWGQRLREQFNRSASHAGWPVVLGWQGFRGQAGTVFPRPAMEEEIVAALRALMKRFGPEETGPAHPAADTGNSRQFR